LLCELPSASVRALAAKKVARPPVPFAAVVIDPNETFETAARRIVTAQKAKTRGERLRRLEIYVFPTLGRLPVFEIRGAHIRTVLEAALDMLCRTSLGHVLQDISGVFDQLWRDEVISDNPARRVKIPPGARDDDRPRIVLTDDEFARLAAWPMINPELRCLIMASRCLGGARTSDLHAWDWEHIDTVHWTSAHVPRPKTSSRDRLAIHDKFVQALRSWWHLEGQPAKGPVFPVREGPRAGERRGKMSHARELRKALWQAGIRRGQTRAECELQTDTLETRKVDFHSLRRAYNTGLAAAGVNVQTAMKLAGHRSPVTHMKYVLPSDPLKVPTEALPSRLSAAADRLGGVSAKQWFERARSADAMLAGALRALSYVLVSKYGTVTTLRPGAASRGPEARGSLRAAP
jgi:integrase